ncbi:MAG: tandem-95 repeat protein, partial [Bacteroidetes bacterium]|nr:tandem-95 repeat protein [Bacteroidota bacterium]
TANATITEPTALSLTESHTNILCNSGTTSLTLTASGGAGTYQYSKDGATFQTSNIFANLTAGAYTFTLKDANGCTKTANATIIQPAAPLTIQETLKNVSCFGDASGSINITTIGGTAPYTYLWNNGTDVKDRNNLHAGVYTVTITDASGCQIQKSISIIQPTSPLKLTETHVNNVCYGNQIGKINVTVKGGTSPYTYLWNNGKQTEDLSGLAGGIYRLNVTDASGCTAQISVTIAPLQPLQITDIVNQVKCFGAGDGSIQLQLIGGQVPYSVIWSNGQNGTQINNLKPGTYSYTAKDDYGCTLQKTFTITQPKPLAGTLKITKTTCKFSRDGSILPLITGGISPYQYFWDSKEIPGNGSINFLAAGKHSFKVIDANGCSLSLIADVLSGNCAPNADNDTYQTLEDTPITINTPGVIINDADPDEDQIKVELSSVGAPNGTKGSTIDNRTNFNTLNGRVSLSNEGSFVYTPKLNFNGVEKFVYKVSDGNLESDYATVTITVLGVNDPPIANDDPFTTPEDTPLSQTVATNDSDPENDPLTYTLINQPAKGTLIFNADGTFIFTPAPNDNGVVTFDYQVCDPSGLCDTAKVTILITPVNDPPVAEDDRFIIERNKPFVNKVTANDYDPENDPLVYSIITQPAHGVIFFKSDGTFTYTPNNGFKGIDTYTYRTCDPFGLCDNATVTLIVQPIVTVNLKPTLATISEGQGIDITATLTESILEDVTINLVFNGTAQNNLDYSLTGNYLTITIPAGQDTTTQKFNLYAINDALQDPGEQAIVNISKTSTAFVLIGTGSLITIDDVYPITLPTGPEENPDISPDPLVSPNGDGQGNEKFVIYNISKYPNNEVVIFNRWGNEVYRVKGYNNEDKSFKGVANVGILTNSNVDLVDGVYYYLIYTEPNSQKKLNKGYLILRR